MRVMVTGGAGYIGSHATQRLLRDGHEVTVVDNLYRGHREPIDLLANQYGDSLCFVHADTGDRQRMLSTLKERNIEAVMHFAALAYVGESVTQPLEYYRNNTSCALSLLQACEEAGVQKFVFSSTCATYGEPDESNIPIPETCPQKPINPYGMSKLHVEHMLFDAAHAMQLRNESFGFAALRYFNVAGCDRSGVLGEDHEPETHLIPVILRAMQGLRDGITIFGTDYDTPDGTCIRDYVHVEDLVDAHVHVMNALQPGDARTYNLGIGNGMSVREVIESAQRVTGLSLNITEGARREGDPPQLYANPAKIKHELGWSASITNLDDIIASAWQWFEKHPEGYKSPAHV
ncbi:MAG: UDP-glucose 4-epimerase GalE [Phycisphaeraceae bacterium]|nr:UDP-glucose 4-epimerase GalE [Phycisphaerales bacterium]MCB9861232.1 UDP-glucose 4-epimerase GalE [Phycisphaeraceae bacterium]